MPIQVYIDRNAIRTYLTEGTPLEVLHIDNLGASTATRITERSPGQDGDSDIDRRLEPRVIPLILQARIIPGYTYKELRALINERFHATNTPIVLGVVFDDGSTYHIDTQSIGDIKLPLSIQDTLIIKVPVILRAANPTFYDPITTTANFQLAASGGAFFVPSFVPTFFGGSTLDQTIVITYTGTYPDFPLLTVYGPITNFKIVNESTGAKLDMLGYSITTGDYYTFDLRYGRKLVYKNGVISDNRLFEVTNDSQLATFNVEADPTVSGGLNQYRVTGTAATGLTRAVLQYNRRFDGI